MAAVRGLSYTLRNSLYLSCTNQSSALSLLASRGPGFRMPTESGFCPLPDDFEPTAQHLFAVGTPPRAVLPRCRPQRSSPRGNILSLPFPHGATQPSATLPDVHTPPSHALRRPAHPCARRTLPHRALRKGCPWVREGQWKMRSRSTRSLRRAWCVPSLQPAAPFEVDEGLKCDAGPTQIFAGLGDPLLRLSIVEETARLIKVAPRRSLLRCRR